MFAALESGNETQFNNLCVVPHTGMLFIANENTKIQTHYIPVSSVNLLKYVELLFFLTIIYFLYMCRA